MNLAKAIIIFVISAVVCATCGTVIGYCLGSFAPSYYYSVFRPQPGMPFDPVAVGIGLGLTQGLIVGLLVGAVLVLAGALLKWRRDAHTDVPFARHA